MQWLLSGGWIVPAVILMLAVGFVLTVKYAASRYRKVAPGRVGIFYGRDFKWQDGKVHGHLLLASGGRVQRPVLESYTEISTSAFQVPIDEKDIPNKDNVKVTVKGVATCKISDDPAGLNNAVAAILPLLADVSDKRGAPDLSGFVLNILKGHLRSIIGQLDIDGLLRRRDEFNKQMVAESAVELQGLGIDLKNLVIQDINDSLGYIDALGKQAVSKATNQALVDVSNAERDAQVTMAENAVKIALAEKDRDVSKAQFKVLADNEKAKAEMALSIATAAQEQELKVAQAHRDAAEKDAQIAVQTKEGERKTAELQATVVATARAEKDKNIIVAEAHKQTEILNAEATAQVALTTAEAQKKAAIAKGEGEASAKQAVLVAEAVGEAAKTKEELMAKALGTEALAKAFAQMNEQGKLIVVLDRLPVLLNTGGDAAAKVMEAIFKSVASPLGQIDNINIVDMGGGDSTNGLDKIGGIVPKVVFNFLAQAKAQGLDIEGILKKLGIDSSKALDMLGFATASEPVSTVSTESKPEAHA